MSLNILMSNKTPIGGYSVLKYVGIIAKKSIIPHHDTTYLKRFFEEYILNAYSIVNKIVKNHSVKSNNLPQSFSIDGTLSKITPIHERTIKINSQTSNK